MVVITEEGLETRSVTVILGWNRGATYASGVLEELVVVVGDCGGGGGGGAALVMIDGEH